MKSKTVLLLAAIVVIPFISQTSVFAQDNPTESKGKSKDKEKTIDLGHGAVSGRRVHGAVTGRRMHRPLTTADSALGDDQGKGDTSTNNKASGKNKDQKDKASHNLKGTVTLIK